MNVKTLIGDTDFMKSVKDVTRKHMVVKRCGIDLIGV